jgi:hypothetical protein
MAQHRLSHTFTVCIPVLLSIGLFMACRAGSYTAAGPVVPSQRLEIGMTLDAANALLKQVPVKRLRTILDSGRILEVYEYTEANNGGQSTVNLWLSFANDRMVHWGTKTQFVRFVEQYHLDIPIP